VPIPLTLLGVPLTEDLINLLGLRRYDLAMSNADRLPEGIEPISPETLEAITHDRLASPNARSPLQHLHQGHPRLTHRAAPGRPKRPGAARVLLAAQ
jgi:hypothetical protein